MAPLLSLRIEAHTIWIEKAFTNASASSAAIRSSCASTIALCATCALVDSHGDVAIAIGNSFALCHSVHGKRWLQARHKGEAYEAHSQFRIRHRPGVERGRSPGAEQTGRQR